MAGPSRPPFNLFLLVAFFAFVIGLIQIGLVQVAFDKLGLSESSAFLLLFSSLGGSMINLPLFRIETEPPRPGSLPPLGRFWFSQHLEYHGRTLIALNVGGGLIPIIFSVYLLQHNTLPIGDALLGTGLVAILARLTSRPIAGLGIGMPIFIAPILAALAALLLNPSHSAPLAYISGTLGVLIGADLLRLRDIRSLGVPMAAIGGAGTFDGIFITGIIAVLLS